MVVGGSAPLLFDYCSRQFRFGYAQSFVRAQQMMKKMTIIFQGFVQSLKLFAFYTKALPPRILLYEGRMSNDFAVEKLMIWGNI